MADDMKNVFKMIEENNVKYVDFRFTDPRGKWQLRPSLSARSTKIC